MIKAMFKSFLETMGKVFGYIAFAAMSIFGIIFFLKKKDKDKTKTMKIDVQNPKKESDYEKGEQLENDINDLYND